MQTRDTSNSFIYDPFLFEQRESEDAAHQIIETILLSAFDILHTHQLQKQIKPYAAKTISQELIMNSMWAKLSIGPNLSINDTIPDDDLEMPRIDSWANGALDVFEDIQLRSSTAEEHSFKKIGKVKEKPSSSLSFQIPEETKEKQTVLSPSKKKKTIQTPKKITSSHTKSQLPNNSASAIQRLFDETKKSTSKNITMDADLNIIEIAERKGMASSLIVPKVATKRFPKIDNTSKTPAKRMTYQRRDTKSQKKKPLPKLLQPDLPTFDETATTEPIADRVICAPGVTFKEGSMVKTMPYVLKPNEISRAQYQAYIDDFTRNSEEDIDTQH